MGVVRSTARKIHNGHTRERERKRREVGVAWGVGGVIYLPTVSDRLLVEGKNGIVVVEVAVGRKVRRRKERLRGGRGAIMVVVSG